MKLNNDYIKCNYSNNKKFINIPDEKFMEMFPKTENYYGKIVKFTSLINNKIFICGVVNNNYPIVTGHKSIIKYITKTIGYARDKEELYVGVRIAIWSYNSRNNKIGYNDCRGHFRVPFDIDNIQVKFKNSVFPRPYETDNDYLLILSRKDFEYARILIKEKRMPKKLNYIQDFKIKDLKTISKYYPNTRVFLEKEYYTIMFNKGEKNE